MASQASLEVSVPAGRLAESQLAELSETSLHDIAISLSDKKHTDFLQVRLNPLLPALFGSLNAELQNIIPFYGRVLPFAPYMAEFVHDRLRPRLARLDRNLWDSTEDEENLREVLLGVFRLMVFDNESFGRYVHAAHLQHLLRHPSRPIRYLAARILCLYLHAADAALQRIMNSHLGDGEILGNWEGKNIDYRFLSLWEEFRSEQITAQLQQNNATQPLVIRFPESDLLSRAAYVGGILLPKTAAKSSGNNIPIVSTATTMQNLRAAAQGILSGNPLLLTGLAGSGKTLIATHLAQQLKKLDSMITLHLNEQSDAKLLIGMYTTGSKPGSFGWKAGVLTTAVREGRWVLIEDLDRAPNEVIATLLPLIENGELTIPGRGEVIRAAHGFRLIATIRTSLNLRGDELVPGSHMIGRRFWREVRVQLPPESELQQIISTTFKQLDAYNSQIMAVHNRLHTLHRDRSLVAKSKGGTLRPLTLRDLFKWCRRVTALLSTSAFSESQLDSVFLEAVDCYAGSLQRGELWEAITHAIAEELHVDPQRRQHLMDNREVKYSLVRKPTPSLRVGRVSLEPLRLSGPKKQSSRPFSINEHSLRIMEQVAVAVKQNESLLLVGETGTGKTTSIQHLADSLGQKLFAFNLSQQSESGDLLGGYKPINSRMLFIPLKDEFDDLFNQTFSQKRNQAFLELMAKCVARSQWKKVCRMWREALRMVDDMLKASAEPDGDSAAETAEHRKKKRKIDNPSNIPRERWGNFAENVKVLENQLSGDQNSFSFAFVEGNIVRAVREGHWVLLDEINLAAPDTLEALADLLGSEANSSLLLTEAGQTERVRAHPNFRIFAAMNPATDVGKKDLPLGIRSRFTEIYVDTPDKDVRSLTRIVEAYIGSNTMDRSVASNVADLYLQLQSMTDQNILADGAGQKPHFSLRTLTRALTYAADMAQYCNLRRALFEGFQMSFLTLLDQITGDAVISVLRQKLFGKNSNAASELKKPLKKPTDGPEYVQDGHHWLRRGRFDAYEQQNYIITPFVRRNLDSLIRAASTRRFPVLIEGPTSSGKTSMIEYLAKKSGNKFVRINNHEHTDLQEYLGSYVSNSEGKLEFQDGMLVKALREGHWVVLDELNLAPTDVLEALNRLLDDNRELLVPETQEVIKPHPDFVLFATQNPAGLYGGRKVLSRAFRNRFLELHFGDIPVDELIEILHRRTRIPESWAKRIVNVYKDLSNLRQENRLFEQKSFATLRDLFRWALRKTETVQDLAVNGYLLLAERARKAEERHAVKEIIEAVMSARGPKVRIDEDQIFSTCPEMDAYEKVNSSGNIVLTKAMRRLFVLIAHAIRNNEPVLLVGETGCGKTTAVQMLAETYGKALNTVNAHQNTETGDLLGAQRPIRNRPAIEQDLRVAISSCLPTDTGSRGSSIVELLGRYDALDQLQKEAIPEWQRHNIQKLRTRRLALFEWSDGSLVQAMRSGDFFLLDEISLADDSVLERLNSVLESQRTVILAEKGSIDSVVTAVDSFKFLATMNPGGDYGKRELSPALRNRFTEIWVPALSDVDDILQVVQAKLTSRVSRYGPVMVSFSQWFNQQFNTSASTTISIRDTLAWCDFVNAQNNEDPVVDIVHGAAMVYIDTIGANPAAMLAVSSNAIEEERSKCLGHLGKLLGADAAEIYSRSVTMDLSKSELGIGGFVVPRIGSAIQDVGIAFDAETTKSNAMRILRALQLPKPVLLEGNPGVGKTSLITALAKVVGKPLTRINLSEQTDLMDLFGSDVPVEGAAAGSFAWRDAPFLRAMKSGEWVLLDEMNLASQSILEGLNSCLDHRAEVYVSELDHTFHRHPDFRLFAAQNPHHQGGGRKGLPASFVNRFTVVYADVFTSNDLLHICKQKFGNIPAGGGYMGDVDEILAKHIRFVSKLEDCVRQRRFGVSGSPWEFNLRDLSRWLELLSFTNDTDDCRLLCQGSSRDYLRIVFTQRFRSAADQKAVEDLFTSVFECDNALVSRSLYHNLSPGSYQVGLGLGSREPNRTACPHRTCELPLEQIPIVESLLICIQMSWPVILVGPSGCGKTNMLKHLASMTGNSLTTFSMNTDVDAMDIIGGYEQLDPLRQISDFAKELKRVAEEKAVQLSNQASNESSNLEHVCDILRLLSESMDQTDYLPNVVTHLSALAKSDQQCDDLLQRATSLQARSTNIDRAQFEWVDGLLVQALERGDWLVLDNANLCSSSVLDRLNSLLEPNGVLIVNERTDTEGNPRLIKPHPKFRIFMTMDARHGELSRAMRNRAIELFVPLPTNLQTASSAAFYSESHSYRFRTFRNLLTQAPNHTDTSQLISVHLENTSYAEQSMMRSFCRQLAAGLFNLLELSHSIQENVARLVQIPSSYFQTAQGELLVESGFQGVQPINPICNESVAVTKGQIDSTIRNRSKEYRAYLDLAEMQQALEFIKQEMASSKARTILEQSITNARKTSRGSSTQLIIFMEESREAILHDMKTWRDSTEAPLDSRRLAAVRSFAVLWWCIFNMVHVVKFDEAAFNIYITLFREFLAEYENSHTFASDQIGSQQRLRKAVSAFDKSTRLNSGLSMERLWRKLRPDTPETLPRLHARLRIEHLAQRFDAIKWKAQSAPETLVHIRRSLKNAMRLATAQDIGSEGMFEDLTAAVDEVEKSIPEDAPELLPHFREDMENIRRLLIIANSGNKSTSEHTALLEIQDLFANDPTTMMAGVADPALVAFQKIFANSSRPTHNIVPSSWTSQLLTRLSDIQHVTLDQLDQLQAEFGVLGQSIAVNTAPLATGWVEPLDSLLKQITDAILQPFDKWLLKDEPDTTEGIAVQPVTRDIKADPGTEKGRSEDSEWANFSRVFEAFLRPCLTYLAATRSPRSEPGPSCAHTWLAIGLAGVFLYVPDRVFDPAMRPAVERDVFLHHRQSLKHLLSALKIFESDFNGCTTSAKQFLIESNLEQLGSEPRVPQICRPKDSELAQLQSEFSNLLRTLEPLANAKSSTEISEAITPAVETNLLGVIGRISKSYREYDDMTMLAVVFVHCIQLGINLKKIAHPSSDMPGSVLQWAPLLSPSTALLTQKSTFVETAQANRDIQAHILHLSAAATSHSVERTPSSNLQQLSAHIFATLFEEWKQRLNIDQQESAAKSRSYHYRGTQQDEDDREDEDFKELFPDYNDDATAHAMEAPGDPLQARAAQLCDLHREIYLDRGDSSERLRNLLMLVSEGKHPLMNGDQQMCQGELLPPLLLRLQSGSSSLRLAHEVPHTYDFYSDPNVMEARYLIVVAKKVEVRFRQLQKAWPEHATIADVIRLCRELLAFGHREPVAKFLTKLEKLHESMHEWQKIASREFSAASNYDQVTNLLVSWRQLELKTWARLFDLEVVKCKEAAKAWWFIAYETIIAVPMVMVKAGDDLSQHVPELLKTLESFFGLTSLGQFEERLQLLKQFREHLAVLMAEYDQLTLVNHALSNFIAYFERYLQPVKDALSKGRQGLEKDIKNVLLMASWKDTNIEALRQSAKASHRKLFKLVRKFREVLNQDAASIIESGQSSHTEVLSTTFELCRKAYIHPDYIFVHPMASQFCEDHIAAWEERPKRFKNTFATISIMFSKAKSLHDIFHGGLEIEKFTADFASSVSELQKATPSMLTEENKKEVLHLKTRKRKLLADTLKFVRQAGFKSNLSSEVLGRQSSVAIVLATIPYVDIGGYDYFPRLLELMTQVRQISRDHSDDLTSGEVSRCVGFLESILQTTIRQRHDLASAKGRVKQLHNSANQYSFFWYSDDYDLPFHSTVSDNIEDIERTISWLQPLLRVSSDIISAQAELGKLDFASVVEGLRQKAIDFEDLKIDIIQLGRSPKGLTTTKIQETLGRATNALQSLTSQIETWIHSFPQLEYILKRVLPWTNVHASVGNSAMSTTDSPSLVNDLSQTVFDCVDKMLAAIQDIEANLSSHPESIEDTNWFIKHNNAWTNQFSKFNLEQILESLQTIMALPLTDKDNSGPSVAAAVIWTVYPIMKQFSIMADNSVIGFNRLHWGTTKFGCTLAAHFVHLARQGFCTPSEKSDEKSGQNDQLEGGTGLGEGEGAEDISKDIQDEDEIGDVAEESGKQERQEDIEEHEDAIEAGEREIDGEMSDVEQKEEEDKDGDESGEEMDEEAGSVDDLGPSTVDEKMWDEGGNDDEKEMKGEQKGGEIGNEQQAVEQQGDGDQNNDKNDAVEEGVESGAEEDEQVGGQEPEQMDQNVQEGEALDLPEDLDFDKGAESDESVNDDDGFDDAGSEQVLENEADQSLPDAEDDEAVPRADSEIREDEGQHGEDEHSENFSPPLDETVDDRSATQTGSPGVVDDRSAGQVHDGQQEPNPGLADESNPDDQATEAAANADDGGQEGDAPMGEAQEQSTTQGQASNAADTGVGQEDDTEDAAAENPFKKLGDTLEKWYNSQRQVKQGQESSDHPPQPQAEDVDMADADFEHLPNDDAAADAQALGAAEEDQARALDQNLETNTDDAERPMDWIEEKEDVNKDVEMIEADQQPSSNEPGDGSRQANAFMGERKERQEMLDGVEAGEDEMDQESDVEEVDNAMSTVDISAAPPTSLEDARSRWAEYENSTRTLSLTLTEQLRLILAPTQATKMRGDFRTGKRLNIKRIIPYIASQYKRDKIWMRRSIPSKRAYQIMIAVDDSRSMADASSSDTSNNSRTDTSNANVSLAFQTLALAAKSLSMLEAGELCVVGFGEDVNVAHSFDTPFTSEAGAQVLSSLTFQQRKTDVHKLIYEGIKLFRDARTRSSGAGRDLWQLMLVISDGICEDHESIRRLLRQANEERIMVVFVVVDNLRSDRKEGAGQSILDLQTAEFTQDPSGGVQVVRKKYMDSFPFRHYLVVRDISALPGVLAAALRQWFAEVVETAG